MNNRFVVHSNIILSRIICLGKAKAAGQKKEQNKIFFIFQPGYFNFFQFSLGKERVCKNFLISSSSEKNQRKISVLFKVEQIVGEHKRLILSLF